MLEIRTVLCPVDFTPLSERAVAMAVHICERFGARLVLEHNLDPGPPNYMAVSWMWSETHDCEDKERAAVAPERLCELLAAIPDSIPNEAKLTRGPVDASLFYLARELPADLLVMGSHGWSSAEHKSLTEQIIADSPCPVLTITDEGDEAEEASLFTEVGKEARPLSVVVPVDFSLRSHAALSYTYAMAAKVPAEIHLLHATGRTVDKPAARERAEEEMRLAKLRLSGLIPEEHEEHAHTHVVCSEATAAITHLSREIEADLIVMGARPKSFLQRFTSGATAFEVLHHRTCPVWFVPAGRKQWSQEPAAAAAAVG